MQFVYVIYSQLHNAVKIGYTNNIGTRFSSIQISTPEKLNILMTLAGGRDLETSIHKRLREYKLSGEWFTWNYDVYTLLQRIQLEYIQDTTAKLLEGSTDYNPNYLFSKNKILDAVSNLTKQFTISDVKKALPGLTLTTKQIESTLLLNGYIFKQYGTARKKHFTREQYRMSDTKTVEAANA